MSWNKKDRIKDLEEKACDGEVDTEIKPLLDIINSNPDYFTTSSCAGRIVLLQLPQIGDKENAEFLGKWHRNVEVEEVMDAFTKAKEELSVFLLAQSPIIHVRCRTLNSAIALRNIAVESGLKYSTLKSLTMNSKSEPVKIVVEILSSENIHVPIAKGKDLYPDEAYLKFIVENANSALLRAQDKIKRFTDMLH
jgi:tRNA wybutosine-synthesizing protein 3